MANQKSGDSVRRIRLQKALKYDSVAPLEEHEAAEYLGISRRSLRKLVKHHVLRCTPRTRRFETDDLQRYMLSRAKTRQEQLEALIHRVRWEAHDMEKYPMCFRIAFLNLYEELWERLAARIAAAGFEEAAWSVRRILGQARERVRMAGVEN